MNGNFCHHGMEGRELGVIVARLSERQMRCLGFMHLLPSIPIVTDFSIHSVLSRYYVKKLLGLLAPGLSPRRHQIKTEVLLVKTANDLCAHTGAAATKKNALAARPCTPPGRRLWSCASVPSYTQRNSFWGIVAASGRAFSLHHTVDRVFKV